MSLKVRTETHFNGFDMVTWDKLEGSRMTCSQVSERIIDVNYWKGKAKEKPGKQILNPV